MPLSKPLYYIITEKLWSGESRNEKKRLFELLAVMATVQLGTLMAFILNAFIPAQTGCFICYLGLLLVPLLAILCLINYRKNCALNLLFTIPLFIYAFYMSEFSNHPPLAETIHHSLWWLLAGLFMLFYFSDSDIKIILYFLVSLFTLVFQLSKADRLFDSFVQFEPVAQHPLVAFLFLFAAGMFLRFKYLNYIAALSDKLSTTQNGISKVFQDSNFPAAHIRAERDEAGNIEKLLIEKVNHQFESEFSINLHEVQEQEASYILELVLKEHVDLHKILSEPKKKQEYYLANLDRWYKIHLLKPSSQKFFLIFENTTKNRKKIADLESSRKRYKVLLEAIPDMFFVIGKDGVYEDFVIKESDLFKVEDANVIGSSIYEVGFPENMANKIHECIHSCLKKNTLETIEYSLNTPNGTFMYEMRLAKLNQRSVISVARDITKRKTAEIGLEKARKKAEESDRLKSAFLSNLSHEIRTPLNIITNFTRMLAESDMEHHEKMELSDAISQNGKQLLNMIDNTIHLSKIETDSVDLRTGFVKINTLLRDVYNRHLPLIPDSKPLKMRINIDVPNPLFGFKTDSRLLSETLEILVDNAIKFTPRGEVAIGYQMIRNEQVKFIVSDTGIGIPAEERENIFSRFYRINNEINQLTSGSGLGLPIAQHYVMLLGGELHFESETDKGSTFWFTLPFWEGEGFLRVVS